MQCYRVKNWNEIYEINRTREIKKMTWLPVPIKLDGDGYTLIMSDPDGANIFGAWIAMLEVAAHCKPRGTLIRGAGIPHDAAGISRVTRIPEKIVKKMLEFCYKKCNWLEIIEIETACDNPAGTCDNPAEGCAVQDIDNIDNIDNITEKREKRREKHSFEAPTIEEVKTYIDENNNTVKEIIAYLNEKCKTKYKATSEHTKRYIKARLNEGFTFNDFRHVIDNKTADWINDPKMIKFLRPETLFGTKFESYLNTKKVCIGLSPEEREKFLNE